MASQSCTLIIENPAGNSISKMISKIQRSDLGTPKVAFSCEEGLAAIQWMNPKLVFLEAELPDGNGFRILEKIKGRNFDLIICSSDSNNKRMASFHEASGFLLSPYHPVLTEQVLNDLQMKKQVGPLEEFFNKAQQERFNLQLSSLAVYSKDGFLFLPIVKIISSYTRKGLAVFELSDSRKIFSSQPLFTFEKALKENGFIKANKGLLVNPVHISGIIPGNPGSIILSNGRIIVCNLRKMDPKP